jgi:flagellin-like protein
MINKMKKFKKGVSAVVATVMIILITFMAIAVLAGFILPMVREGLEEGASCFELREYGKVLQSKYTCYTDLNTSVMIERGLDNYSIDGFAVSIKGGLEQRRYNIEADGASGGTVWMYASDGTLTTDVTIPEAGGAKTYVFDLPEGTSVELGLISKGGDICEMGTYTIPIC